jgi:hypothetical protein
MSIRYCPVHWAKLTHKHLINNAFLTIVDGVELNPTRLFPAIRWGVVADERRQDAICAADEFFALAHTHAGCRPS